MKLDRGFVVAQGTVERGLIQQRRCLGHRIGCPHQGRWRVLRIRVVVLAQSGALQHAALGQAAKANGEFLVGLTRIVTVERKALGSHLTTLHDLEERRHARTIDIVLRQHGQIFKGQLIILVVPRTLLQQGNVVDARINAEGIGGHVLRVDSDCQT